MLAFTRRPDVGRGLLNHREFVIMLGGLMLISVLGILLDIYLAVLIGYKVTG